MPPTSASEATADLNVHQPPHNSSASAVAPPPTSCSGRSCPWWPYSSSKDFTSNAALILTILFSALLIALALNAAIRYFIRRRSNIPGEDDDDDVEAAERKQAASALVDLEGVPKLVFSPGMKLGGTEATECTICLSEFVEGDAIRVLEKCSHGFHFQCVQKWLVSHTSCPTCRTNCSR